MPGQGFVFLASLFILILVIALVRDRRLSENLSLFWLIFSALMMAGSSFAFSHLFEIARLVGVVYPPSALFLLALLFLLVFTLYLSTAISRLSDQAKVLAQELALLRFQVAQSGPGEDRATNPPPSAS